MSEVENLDGGSKLEDSMRAYLITSGTIFTLIVAAHILRGFAEGWSHVLRDPFFVLFTVLAAGLSGWAFVILRSSTKHP